jgi:FmdE protein associated with molybdenum formylmethanofuran dehydrogenase
MRKTWIFMVAVVSALVNPAANAHELWFHPGAGGDSALVRLSFGDTPDLGEAERVAEIAHTKVWADGNPLEVKRLPDGLEARLPERRPAVVSAFADRGVVNYMGDSFIIFLAAYAQTRAIEPDQAANLGLGDDQVRLLLVSRGDGPPVVRALWKGKPAAGASVKVFHGHEDPTEVRTDSQGEIPCPDLREGPWSLLVQVMDKTPGKRDGRDYTHIRYKATLAIGSEAAFGPAVAACLARVKEVHGAAGPWAVTGYRIGERALKELGLHRHSHSLEVIHRCPAEVQYSCIADGVQAATGASPGKLNLHIEEATRDALKTVIRDKKSGRTLTFTLKPEFARSITNLTGNRLATEGRRVAEIPDDAIFSVTEAK